MPEYSDYIESRDEAATLDGSEQIAMSQSGESVKASLQRIIDEVGGGGGGGGHVIQEEGTPLAQRANLNFVGSGVTATDDSGNDATVVTITAGGHVIEDEGTPLTQRANMNFTGAGVSVTDAGGKTVVTIPDGGAGKQDTLVSGTNIKTVNGVSLLGSGDIDLIDDAIVNGEAKAPSQNAVFDALATKVNNTGDETIAGVKTFSSDPIIPDEAYDATAWNGSLEPPTKNAIRDKIESIDPIGVQDLFIPAAAMWPRITNGCAAISAFEMATSLFNVQALAFDQTAQEFAQFQIVLPRKYNNSTITATPVWTATSGSGTVQWGVSFGSYRNDDALTVAFGTAQTSDDTLIATNDLHVGPDTAAITPAGTLQDGNFMGGQISRNPASDTLSADALLLGLWLHITVDAGKDA